MKIFLKKYPVTITFTVLAILNLLSNWGSIEYRLIMVVLNIICGFGMEYLVNKKAASPKYNLWKGCIALILLIINVVLILVKII